MQLMLSSNDPGKVYVDTVKIIILLGADNDLEHSSLFLYCKTSLCTFNFIDIAHPITFTSSPFFKFPITNFPPHGNSWYLEAISQ